jgi:telomerase reverse transcriptase
VNESEFVRSILVDQVNYKFIERDEIIELLKTHLLENTTKIGTKFYKRIQGIPQGGILSTLLCSILYTDLEEKHFKCRDALLLRFVDDFLFITPNEKEAVAFIDQMEAGYPEYGVTIKKEKTWLSFPYKDYSHQEDLAWCGYKIASSNLNWFYDFRKNQEISEIGSSLERFHPGEQLRKSMLYTTSQKVNALILDPVYQSKTSISLNLFQICVFIAKKMYWSSKNLEFLNHTFFVNLISEIKVYIWIIIKTRTIFMGHGKEAPSFPLTKYLSNWIFLNAFWAVLTIKQTKWTTILDWINKQLKRIELTQEERNFMDEICDPRNSPDVFTVKF